MSALTKRSVSHTTALALLDAAAGRAAELAAPVAIAIVDESAVLKAFLRTDHANLLPVQVAQAKARTAVSIGFDTGGLYDALDADPTLRSGLIAQPGITLMGGGLVLRSDGEVIGAIGVSGGSTDQDIDIAEAARTALGL
tara:strand:+ start:3650 stop:4069 length:420 start_codon:yes stop_codon:yes gene_type:complete